MECWAGSGVSVSASGVIAYQPTSMARADVRVYDRNGSILRTLLSERGVYEPVLSPDGSRLLMSMWNTTKGAPDIWIVDIARGVRTRITGGLASNNAPNWSPDGTRVVYLSDRAGMYDIYVQTVDDPSPPQTLWRSANDKEDPVWTPDGNSIITGSDDSGSRGDLYSLSMTGQARLLLTTGAWEDEPAVSPDGRWLAFTSRGPNSSDVFVMPMGGGRITQISSSGGQSAAWSGDGSELFYIGPGRKLMAVRMTPAPGVPKPLFDLPRTSGDPHFSVTPDGHFLVAALNLNASVPQHINVIR
jgi:Tol biopolymer transport system component